LPVRDLNHWRSASISEISAIGTLNICEANRVMRSKRSSGGLPRSLSCRNASSRRSSSGAAAACQRARVRKMAACSLVRRYCRLHGAITYSVIAASAA